MQSTGSHNSEADIKNTYMSLHKTISLFYFLVKIDTVYFKGRDQSVCFRMSQYKNAKYKKNFGF